MAYGRPQRQLITVKLPSYTAIAFIIREIFITDFRKKKKKCMYITRDKNVYCTLYYYYENRNNGRKVLEDILNYVLIVA